jgi:iron complex transport system permease protein
MLRPVTGRAPAATRRAAGPRGPVRLTLAAIAVLLGVSMLAVCIGVTPYSPGAVLSTIADQLGITIGTPMEGTQAAPLLQLRLPRVLLAALVGGLLSMAGATYQGVFRNPLADPYLLGAAAGAGLGATAVITLAPGLSIGPAGLVPMAAFAGALGGVGLSFAVGRAAAGGSAGSGATLLLAGVAVASFLTAVQTVLQQAHSDDLRAVYSWILGQLGSAGWDQVLVLLPYAALSVAGMIATGRALDVLALGDDEAASLGVNPARIRLFAVACASLATAAAVAVGGLIGFVGLVVPHIVRRLAGGSHRILLPMSLLGGASFLVLADLASRTLLAPAELPIGVVTAFVGAPFFALLLRIRSTA